MAPIPKPRGQRQNRIKRAEIGILPVKDPGELAAIVPEAPRNLLKRSVERWVAFWTSPLAGAVDHVTDRNRVERWIRYVDELDRVEPVFRKTRLVKGSTGQ